MTDVVREQAARQDAVVSSTTLILIVFIIILSLLVMLLLLLLLLFYWQRLHATIYHHHHSPLTKSSASSPLAPPRYVAGSQLSSVIDCSDLDVHSATWVHGALKTIDAKEELEEQDDGEDGSCSGDSVEKPPLLLDARSNASTPTVSCEQLSTLDCDTVDDDDVTSSTRHNDVTAAHASHGLCNTVYRYSW